MARKGNQQKNGCDIFSSNNKKGDADSRYGSSGAKGRGRSSSVKIVSEELLDTDHVRTPLSEGVKVAVSSRDSGRKRNKKSGKSRITGENHAAQSLEHLNHNNSTDGMEDSGLRENDLLLDSDNASAYRSSSIHHSFKGLAIEDAVHKVHISCITVIRILKAYGLSILKTSYEWLDRHKPLFITISNNILSVSHYAQLKCMQAYPVVLKWLVHFANVLLLMSMVWLDCALRGMDSFMRMGTSSFFAIIWLSTFSVISMIGMLKFLLVLVVATVIGFFSSLIIALMAISISGAVILWLYGSFWTTIIIIGIGGLAFALTHERIALLIVSMYAVYCACIYVGWLGVLLALNLSFISSDALIYLLKSNFDEQRSSASERTAGMQGQRDFGTETNYSYSEAESSADRSCGFASTSGTESEITSEDEVVRLLNCTDHYAALGFSRYEHVDVSILKREYRRKAMLVHPDKNMGNDKAAEAFKKLQNAYEVLLDSLKRKAYDDELRREELLSCFRRFQSTSQKNGRSSFFPDGFERSEVASEDPFGELRRIACKKCGNFHIWIQTKKSKSQARWCQDCKDFHHAKDGDGWVEQSSQPFLFGIMQKVEAPAAYVCADSKVYDATEWYICQGMRCPVNSHKPSFHVNTSVTRPTHAKGTTSSHRGGMPSSNAEENMTEEELFEWLQNAMQAGVFGESAGSTSSETPETRAKSGPRAGASSGASGGSGGKRKKKGKRW